jgi:hypothetical protein
MFMVREVLHCRPGKVGSLKKMFTSLNGVMAEMKLAPFRLYTDVAGARFWTLVLERDYASLDEVHSLESKVMSDERAGKVMGGYHDLVEQGSREIYKVEA